MSKNISVIFLLLIIIVAGFAYFNYSQLNEVQTDLLNKEALLSESERLIKEQEASLNQMEEKIKEILVKEEVSLGEQAQEENRDELKKQLEMYRDELLVMQVKVEEILQKSKTDTEDINLLREEKSRLEPLLIEREVKWQEKEEESKEAISSLQKEIQQYESDIELVKNKVLQIEQYFESEQLKRYDLEESIAKYEETIERLNEQLSLKRDDEAFVQQISQLQLNKKELEEEIEQKDSLLSQFQQERQNLQDQLTQYEQKIDKLQEETTQALAQKEILSEIKDNISQLEQEKQKMEKLLQEKETQWLEREQIDKETIALLQEEVKKYESNIKEIGSEIITLREDLIKDKSLSEPIQKEMDIDSFRRIIADKEIEWAKEKEQNQRLVLHLKEQLEEYKKEVESVRFDSSLLKEEMGSQMALYQENLVQIGEKEDEIMSLTSQIEQFMVKMDNYEKNVAELRTTLQQQEGIDYEEKLNLIETISSLVKEREEYQNSINKYYSQVCQFQLEIAELKNKIEILEREKDSNFYEVKSGDSLWAIARNKYREGIAWIKIFKANEDLIENPNLIFPYQQFILPE